MQKLIHDKPKPARWDGKDVLAANVYRAPNRYTDEPPEHAGVMIWIDREYSECFWRAPDVTYWNGVQYEPATTQLPLPEDPEEHHENTENQQHISIFEPLNTTRPPYFPRPTYQNNNVNF